MLVLLCILLYCYNKIYDIDINDGEIIEFYEYDIENNINLNIKSKYK